MPPGGRAVSLQARPVSSQEKSIANAFEVVPPARNVSALAERGAGIGHADDANAPDAGDVARRPVSAGCATHAIRADERGTPAGTSRTRRGRPRTDRGVGETALA